MKKGIIALVFLLLCSFVYQANAATCTAQGAGNWWTSATWSCGGETRVPAAGDDVALAGYVITWDVANGVRIPATSGSLGTITSTGTAGQITVDLSAADCHGDGTCSLTATTITAGTKPTTAGIILVTGSGTISDHILDINCTSITGGSNSSAAGLNNNSTGTVNVTGNAVGSSAASGAHGVMNYSTGVINLSGNATGGTTQSAGFYNLSTGTGSISGTVTGSSSGNMACGFVGVGAGEVTLSGNIIDGTGSMGWCGNPPTWNPGTTNYHQMTTDSGTHYFFGHDSSTYTLTGGGGAWLF
jgi:hypothetical protein